MGYKKVAIVQSNYIPWKGYFDLIQSVDAFVLLDDVQYTRRDWRNRNRIRTAQGSQWLTIPVEVKGKYTQLINETRISDKEWNKKHLKSLLFNYSSAPYFDDYRDWLEELYLGNDEILLSGINRSFIQSINSLLNIKTPLLSSESFHTSSDKSLRLLEICTQLGAIEYVSGPAASTYLDESTFNANGVEVTWFDYSNYPVYEQCFEPYDSYVSILDLILNKGPEATQFMKGF